MPIKLLLDRSVRSYGEVAHVIRVPLEGYANKLALIQARPIRKDQTGWAQNQIESLPTIAKLAKDGELQLFTYQELEFEWMRGASSFPRNIFGDVFKGINLHWAQSAVERSSFFQEDGRAYVQKESQTTFCQWLLETDFENLLKSSNLRSRLGERQVENLNNIKRYKDICKSLTESQYTDGLHLWTAELNEMDFFLTSDKKFVNALNANHQLRLTCHPIFPSALLGELKVRDRQPLPFEYGRRYTLAGIPYD